MKIGFFPPLAFDADQKSNDFIVSWYTRHLAAMKEPSLWVISDDASRQIYRFLWLRTFHQPVVVRLEIDSQGAGELIAKVTDGEGGYGPGKIVFKQVSALLQP